MSTRQNKKRKSRNSVNNGRERTITNLTDESVGSMSMTMSSSNTTMANNNSSGSSNNLSPTSLQNPANFTFQSPYTSPISSNPQPSSLPHQRFDVSLPPGKNDLEILENLKDIIKSGQHQFFRAAPKPAALASIYLGPNALPQVPRSVQSPSDLQSLHSSYYDSNNPSGSAGNLSSIEPGGRPSRMQTDENRETASLKKPTSQTSVSGSQTFINQTNKPPGPQSPPSWSSTNVKAHATAGTSAAGIKPSPEPRSVDTRPSSGPSDFDDSRPKFESSQDQSNSFRSQMGHQPSAKSDPLRSVDKETSFSAGNSTDPKQLFYEKQEEHRVPRADDDRRARRDTDQTLNFSDRSNEGSRFVDDDHSARDNGLRYSERERERDSERDRNFERDRERDRRTDFRGRDDRRPDFRRPSLDQRFHGPRFPADAMRRFDQTPSADETTDLNRRTELPSPSNQSGDRPTVGDRLASRGTAVSGDRASRVPLDERRVLPVEQGARTLAVQASGEGGSHPTLEERGTRRSVSSHGGDDRARPSIPLEERLVRPPPPLQDRLAQASGPRGENNRLSRQSTLEERLSHADLGTVDDSSIRPSLQPDDRQREPPGIADRPRPDDRDRLSETGRHSSSDVRPAAPVGYPSRPRERFVRQMTPVQDRPQLLRNRNVGFSSTQDTSPPLENIAHPAKSSPSPPPSRAEPRDYRGLPGRELSRDAGNTRPTAYRPEAPRGYHDNRRPDLMDIDMTESRASLRRFTSLSPAGTEMNRDRGRDFYPSPPHDAPDIDRRERPDWQFGGRREWNNDNEDHWKTRRPWERRNTSDRERYDRNAPAQDREWETREERERNRPPFRSDSPTRSLDGSQHRPPLSTRLTEGYSEERGYPPGNIDRPRYPVPFDHPYARIRQRSPSPISRRPSNDVDSRPPIKRAREESGPYPAYYSPPPPLRPMATASNDFVAHTPSSPPTGRFYDRPSTLTGPTHDREFTDARERSDVGAGYPMSFNRPPPPPRAPHLPRIPPSGFGRGGFGRDTREDRRYNNIPLPRSS